MPPYGGFCASRDSTTAHRSCSSSGPISVGDGRRSSKPRKLAELVIDGKPDGTDFGMDEETERLESLRKPFLSLLAKAQEES